jgi:hypothetical protein
MITNGGGEARNLLSSESLPALVNLLGLLFGPWSTVCWWPEPLFSCVGDKDEGPSSTYSAAPTGGAAGCPEGGTHYS